MKTFSTFSSSDLRWPRTSHSRHRAFKKFFTARLLLAFSLGVLTSAFAVDTPIDATIVSNGANNVLTIWNATPGRTYRLQSTTNLTTPWLDALPAPGTLTASSNSLFKVFSANGLTRFFRVLAVDTEGPDVYRTEPAAGGIAVSRSAPLRAWLRDVSGIAANTIALTIANASTTNTAVKVGDARLQFDGTILTYTPANNEFLGAAGDTVSVRIAAADMAGNQTTNFTWSFQLELPAVASTNLVFIRGSVAPQSVPSS